MFHGLISASLPKSEVGAKAWWLARTDLPTPKSLVVGTGFCVEALRQVSVEELLADIDFARLETLFDVSAEIRRKITQVPLPTGFIKDLERYLAQLGPTLAIRSSSPQEDGRRLSFAGQFDSFLRITNDPAVVADYVRHVWASLYTARAISYRHHNRVSQTDVAMAVLIQDFVPGPSGVLFTENPGSDQDEILIEVSDKGVVHGRETPRSILIAGGDDVRDYPPHLKEIHVFQLVIGSRALAKKFGSPLDVEWVVGPKGLVWTQIRPLTIDRVAPAAPARKQKGIPILIGAAVGSGSVSDLVYKATHPEDVQFPGGVLVVRDTSPEWEPLMRRARALITDHGCRTSHAALTAAEMGLPAVVGTMDGTASVVTGQRVTLELQGDTGFVYGGRGDG